MPSLNDIASIVVAGGILLAVLVVIILIFRHVRKHGSRYTHIVLGATYEVLNEDRRKSGEVILKKKAGQKESEQDRGQKHEEGSS
jgi:hypothetical protein